MENASKAIIMAGGVFVTVLVISLFLYVITSLRDYNDQMSDISTSSQIESFNRYFFYSKTRGYQIKGFDAINLINKANDLNASLDVDYRIGVSCPNELQSIVSSLRGKNEAQREEYLNSDVTIQSLMKNYSFSYSFGSDGRVSAIIISG